MPALIRQRALGAKPETTEGTFNTPASANAGIHIYNPKIDFKPDLFKRNPARASLSPLAPITGILRGTISFRCEIKGPDNVSSNLGIPEIDVLLRACGYKRIDTGAAPVTARAYKPTSYMKPHLTTTLSAGATAGSSVSIQVTSSTGFAIGDVVNIAGSSLAREEGNMTITAIADGTHITVDTLTANKNNGDTVERVSAAIPLSLEIQDAEKSYRMRGARGNAKIMCKVGEPAMIDFTFSGGVETVTDSFTAFAPTFGSKTPPAFFSAGLNLGGAYSGATFTSIEFDTANVLGPRESGNSSTGILSTLITNREPKGKFDPESVTEATYAYWTKLLASTGASLSVAVGSTSKNRVTITSPAIVLDQIADEERTGISTYGVGFTCTTTGTGEDELVITYD